MKHLYSITLLLAACFAVPMHALAQDAAAEKAPTAADAPAEAQTADQKTDSNADDPTQKGMPDAETLTQTQLNKTLHEVTTRVDTLKEDTFSTKSRLLLLREEVLQRTVSGSRLLVKHEDDMGGQYELLQIHFVIDGEPTYSRIMTNNESLDVDDEVIFDGVLAPGTHQISVKYVYRGKTWGVFSYMKDYAFNVESGYAFVIDEGKSAELTVTADEQGKWYTPYEERPSVKYKYEQFEMASEATHDAQNND